MFGGVGDEPIELVAPEGLDHRAELTHPTPVEPIMPFAALLPGRDETDLSEKAQMLRYRGTGDRELRCELADGALP